MWKMKESDNSMKGYKDKQTALNTLKELEDRDIKYQYQTILSYVMFARRTLKLTKAEQKLDNIKEALKVFEKWLEDYRKNNRVKENLNYLPLKTIRGFRALAKKYDILEDDFCKAYEKEKGEYKKMRGVKVKDGEITWDIERNRRLKEIIEKIKKNNIQWYETDVGDYRGLPTKEHVQCIMLGYSPDPSKVKNLIPQVEEGKKSEKEMDVDEEERKGVKRSHSSSSSSESEDEPKSKVAKKAPESKDEEEGSGLSFKDKEKAQKSIKSLEGRDISYQYHAIAGLVKRAERVITLTKDEQKIKNMKEAIKVFEDWITDYNVNGRAKENFNYLPLDLVQGFKPLADKYKIEDNKFLQAYEEAGGDYKKLRSVPVAESSSLTWDIERNKNLKSLVDEIKKNDNVWFHAEGEMEGLPTEEHTRCIMWAFSYDSSKLKKLLPSLTEKLKL